MIYGVLIPVVSKGGENFTITKSAIYDDESGMKE
jgi:hypothetical protein